MFALFHKKRWSFDAASHFICELIKLNDRAKSMKLKPSKGIGYEAAERDWKGLSQIWFIEMAHFIGWPNRFWLNGVAH